uniref:Uncharacterized protein n=1 Tax=Romanomermis culicivorax TaxID=13658 RepID=A0A915KUP6_ROMCU
MQQTMSALLSNTSAPGYGLPKSESDDACRCSGFSTSTDTCPTAAATEIRDTDHFTLVKDAEND